MSDAPQQTVGVQTVAPATVEALVQVLTGLSRDGARVALQGAGTKAGWLTARPCGPVDVVATTTALRRVVYHHAGDLTVSVEAGASLTEVNAELARHGQWIPLDPPFARRATVGGIVASNDSGPRRHRYGAPRDMVIGMAIVLADGTLARSGGNVVKNVAGYDLARLFTGSYGSLGAIATINLKLSPLPSRSLTVVAGFGSGRALAAASAALVASQSTVSAMDWSWPPMRLLVRLESTAAALPSLVDGVTATLRAHAVSLDTASGATEDELWRAHDAAMWEAGGDILKVGTRVGDLGALVDALAAPDRTGAEVAGVGRAGVGVHYVRAGGDRRARQAVADAVSAAVRPRQGTVELLRGDDVTLPGLAANAGALALMRAVKREFDPDARMRNGWPEIFE